MYMIGWMDGELNISICQYFMQCIIVYGWLVGWMDGWGALEGNLSKLN